MRAIASQGTRPYHRFLGLVGGILVTFLGVASLIGAATATSNTRGAVKFGIFMTIGGLAWLATSCFVEGADFLREGIRAWKYKFWFGGENRLITAAQIASAALTDENGKYLVKLKLHDGTEWALPARFVSVKDAQELVDALGENYGAAAGLEIKDQKQLQEAARFANAERCQVMASKRNKAEGEVLSITDSDGSSRGEVRFWDGWFSKRAAASETPNAATPRWTFTAKGKKGLIADNGKDAGSADVYRKFTETGLTLIWTDPAQITWCACFTSESDEKRTPFVIRFYRGVPANIAKPGRSDEAELVAIANGPANNFTLDVAEEDAWPWVRNALALTWLVHRPSFKAK